MKPILLKIKGLNSFVQEQNIPFDKLTEKGFFGIFGPTGSGKSTILDGITMALYGKITRDNKGFINSESDRLEVSYTFSIGLGDNIKEYQCDRCIKVDKNGGYKTTLARIYKLNGENNEVIAEGAVNVRNAVESIIGLSVDDFTRSVVLPQGKFSEFLKLTGLDRRSMLERIFKLERYGRGLRDKIKKLKEQEEKKLIELNGELNRYNDVSKEKVDILKEELKVLEEKEETLKKEKEKIDKLYEEYTTLWNTKKELQNYIQQQSELVKRAEDIENKKVKLEYGKNAFNIKPFIDEVKNTEDSVKINKTKLKEKEELLIDINQKLLLLQREYEVALENQREKTPKLVKKATELARAVDINKRVKEVEKERQELRSKYDNLNKKIKSLEAILLDITTKREALINDLDELEKSLTNKTISPEYRNSIYSAYDKYCKYKELNANIILLNEKYNTFSENIKNNKKQFIEIKNKKINLDGSINALIENREAIQKNCPGDGETLLKAQQEVTSVRERTEKILICLDTKGTLDKKYEDILLKKKELQEKINSLNLEYDHEINELKNSEKLFKEKYNENIAAMLAKELQEGNPCPVCGSVHHVKKANFISENELKHMEELTKELKEKCEVLKENINHYNINMAAVDRDKQYLEEELKKVNKELEGIGIEKLQEEVKAKEVHFTNLREKINKWNEELNNLEKDLEYKREEKASIDKMYTSLEEKISAAQYNLKSINEDLKDANGKCSNVFKEYTDIIKVLEVENIELEINKIKSWDEEIVKLKKQEKEKRSAVDKLNLQREEIQREVSNLQSERAQITQSGTEKKNFIDEYGEEVKRICGEEDPEESILKVNKEIDYINTTEKSLRDKLELKKNEKNNFDKEKSSLEKNLETLNGILKNQKENLYIKLKEYSFEDEKQALECFITKEHIENLQQIISKYEDDKIKLEDNIKRLEDKLSGSDITEEKWQQTKEYKLQLQENLNECIEMKAQKKKELNDTIRDLEKVMGLLEKREKYQHKYSLCEELDDLVKGNKFVEFVAMNELKYIAIEASKRLKSITKGRYALEIDVDGNFIMRDDFNGGARRHTSTLSGGETFLTSLSLALALSSQIQLKGSAPLQFFFLDEGFGTLDNNLLDVVMTSLEKLRSENLSVGIISHVDELKNRVPVKLIVNAPVSGVSGSEVKVEYS